jgi:hypothetical protein
MENVAPTPADAPAAPSRTNRGWFKRGDARINRHGRPRKRPPRPPRPAPEEWPLNGQLRNLHVPIGDLRMYLAGCKAPWIINLPSDYEIVSARCRQESVVLTITSKTFSSVPAGEAIPVFRAEYNGLRWRPHHRW